jgi:hypothetical protein
MTDLMTYIDTAHTSATYLEPLSTVDKSSINYYQLFEELKSVLNTLCTYFSYAAIKYTYLK